MQQNKPFKLCSKFAPAGDQISAISELTNSLRDNNKNQVLLGVTGSGKTFTMANIIQNIQKPSLIFAHNKTLAAQLYSEMKEFFPENAVEYFVSYYDYYQPEAYIARTDTYIEKDASINEQIELLRHSATRSLFERKDVIVIASVSCIYGIGSPDTYGNMTIPIQTGMKLNLNDFVRSLVKLQYERSDYEFLRGKFRVKGDIVDLFPAHLEQEAWRFCFFGDELEEIKIIDSLSGKKISTLDSCRIYANSHYVTPEQILKQAIPKIEEELQERIRYFKEKNLLVEAKRIEQRTYFDLEMIQETGSCKGIENYSRYLSQRTAGEAPPTLFEYLSKDSLLFIDESHVTVPQLRAMYNGDRARKTNLVEHGFRLPSALDNRPLTYDEWDKLRPQTVFVSATPGKQELEYSGGKYTRQIIRPTGLLDPECFIKPASSQVDDLLNECQKTVKQGLRVLVTTLTKKMAENLASYLQEIGLKVTYLHSDIKTLERVETIRSLRSGEIDVLVGVNLLREGLDIPECGMVAILDADKEGFLRSETSLIQTIGRAARNANSRVLLYADKMTNSLEKALSETNRRRELQIAHNKKHGITPQTITKNSNKLSSLLSKDIEKESLSKELKNKEKDLSKDINKLRKEMLHAASNLEFEKAASIRDKIKKIEDLLLY